MDSATIGILFAVVTFALLFSGLPIAFALGLSSLAFMMLFMSVANVHEVAFKLYKGLEDFTLLTIPLFVLMGAAVGKTRAGADVYGSLNAWLHRIPGGLGIANVFACSVFAAMCGSSPATCSAIGSSGIPQLRARGYSDGLAAGLIAAGGTLGILIPPSLTFILYGIVTEQSINKLFLAGVGPGILLTVLFAGWVTIKFQMERRAALATLAGGDGQGRILQQEHYSWRERLGALPRLLPFLLLITIVMVAMYTGWGTPSEVAAVGALGSLILVMTVYGCWRLNDLKAILSGTMRESTMIMMIIATSFLFSYVMSDLGVTQKVAGWLVSLGLGKWEFFLWTCVFMVVLGFFLPPVAIILMVMPIILPALQALRIDLIWYGVIVTILMEMGLIHPPVGLNLFVIQGIAPDITMRSIIWGTLPFIFIMVLGIALLSWFPEIALWLPSQVMGPAR